MNSPENPNTTQEHTHRLPSEFIKERDNLLVQVARFEATTILRIKNKDFVSIEIDLDNILKQLQKLKENYIQLQIPPKPNAKIEEITIPKILLDKENDILNTPEFQLKLQYGTTSGNFSLAEACLETTKDKIVELEKQSKVK